MMVKTIVSLSNERFQLMVVWQRARGGQVVNVSAKMFVDDISAQSSFKHSEVYLINLPHKSC